jgi:ribosome-binding protein aMBF1 (putative translation factor)
MASILPEALASGHLPLPETAGRPAKAQLRKPEPVDFQAQIARCVTRARLLVGWSKKELAAAVNKDESQIVRWESGKERPQFDALWSVSELRSPLVIAMAELAEGVTVETVIKVQRIA